VPGAVKPKKEITMEERVAELKKRADRKYKY
jgi:hypothetical protein